MLQIPPFASQEVLTNYTIQITSKNIWKIDV